MTLYALGIVLYQLYVGLDAYLCAVLIRDKQHREYPAFTVYASACLLKSTILFPLFVSRHLALYGALWWYLRPVMFFLLATVILELLAKAYPEERLTRAPVLAALVPAGWLTVNLSLNLDRGLRFATFAALAGIYPKLTVVPAKVVAIASGVLAITVLPAAAEYAPSFVDKSLLQFIPTVSALVALAVWIKRFK